MSPDATSGDALKRVTGLSVVDNKYIFVRGVTDRYNETALNGLTVTSTDTDVDKKSFSFDLIPASLLSNTVVVKTAKGRVVVPAHHFQDSCSVIVSEEA